MAILLYAVIVVSLIALLFCILKRAEILLYPRGNRKMVEISDLIHKGAMTFLNSEYKLLAIFIAVVALIWFSFHPVVADMFWLSHYSTPCKITGLPSQFLPNYSKSTEFINSNG